MNKHYPDGHPVTIYSLDDYGETLIRTGHVQEGIEVLYQALNMAEKFSMNKHFTTAWIFYDLSFGYFKNKNYPLALEYSEKALALRKEIYNEVKNHIELAESLYISGDIYMALKNRKEALKLYQEAMNMYIALSLEYLPQADEIKQKIKELI